MRFSRLQFQIDSWFFVWRFPWHAHLIYTLFCPSVCRSCFKRCKRYFLRFRDFQLECYCSWRMGPSDLRRWTEGRAISAWRHRTRYLLDPLPENIKRNYSYMVIFIYVIISVQYIHVPRIRQWAIIWWKPTNTIHELPSLKIKIIGEIFSEHMVCKM